MSREDNTTSIDTKRRRRKKLKKRKKVPLGHFFEGSFKDVMKNIDQYIEEDVRPALLLYLAMQERMRKRERRN